MSHLYCLSDIFLLVQLSFSPGVIRCVNPGHMIIAGPTPTSLPRFRFLRRTKPFARPRWRPWLDTDVLVFHRASALSVNGENESESSGNMRNKTYQQWRRTLKNNNGATSHSHCVSLSDKSVKSAYIGGPKETMARPLQDHSRRLRRRGSPSVRCASREVNFKNLISQNEERKSQLLSDHFVNAKGPKQGVGTSRQHQQQQHGAVLTTSSCSQRHAANKKMSNEAEIKDYTSKISRCWRASASGRAPATGVSRNIRMGLDPVKEGAIELGGFLLSQFMEMKPTS